MAKVRRVEVLMRAMGRRLRASRITAGFETADQLATRLDLHPQRYRKYERGDSVPPLDVLETLKRTLSIDLDWLLLGAGQNVTDRGADQGPEKAI